MYQLKQQNDQHFKQIEEMKKQHAKQIEGLLEKVGNNNTHIENQQNINIRWAYSTNSTSLTN